MGTCIAHEVNPRAHLHFVTKLIVEGGPQRKLRDLLPDRVLASHPEFYVGDRSTLSESPGIAVLGPGALPSEVDSDSAPRGPASAASLTSSSIASRITRSVSSSKCACNSSDNATNSGQSVRS